MNQKFSRPLLLLALVAAYFAAGSLGLKFAGLHPSASPVWLGTGIAVAAMLIFGRDVWPAIFAGAFLVNAVNPGAAMSAGLNLIQAAGIATGNTLEALAA